MKCPSCTGIRESERFGTPPGRASSITRAGKEDSSANSKYRAGRVSGLSVHGARNAWAYEPGAASGHRCTQETNHVSGPLLKIMPSDKGPCKAESTAGWLQTVGSPRPGLLKHMAPGVQSTSHSWLMGGVREL